MPAKIDVSGERYGDLVAISRAGTGTSNKSWRAGKEHEYIPTRGYQWISVYIPSPQKPETLRQVTAKELRRIAHYLTKPSEANALLEAADMLEGDEP